RLDRHGGRLQQHRANTRPLHALPEPALRDRRTGGRSARASCPCPPASRQAVAAAAPSAGLDLPLAPRRHRPGRAQLVAARPAEAQTLLAFRSASPPVDWHSPLTCLLLKSPAALRAL